MTRHAPAPQLKTAKPVPSAVITECQNLFYPLKDALAPAWVASAKADALAADARSDAEYAEHKVHVMAVFLDEQCDTDEYFLGVADELKIPVADCRYCSEDALEEQAQP